MNKLDQEQMKELEQHLADYQQVDKNRIFFNDIAKNNLVAVTHCFRTFKVRYIVISSGMPKMAMVQVLN